MDKNKFLTSGLLEQYVLRLTSPEEDELVEHYAEAFPEIKKEIENMRDGLEQYAQQYAVAPPEHMKGKIMEEISRLETTPTPNTAPPRRIPSYWSWARTGMVAAYAILGIFLAARYWNLRQEHQRLTQQLENCSAEKIELTKDAGIVALLRDQTTQSILLKGTPLAPQAQALVLWNEGNGGAVLNLLNLPPPPPNQQYQIWADVAGKMISVGLLDWSKNQWQAIQYLDQATSLNITLEPRGGSKEPTVARLVANGLI